MIFPFQKLRFLLACSIACLFMTSCKQIDVFEKNTPIPHYKWQHNYSASGTFTISDTTSAYDMFLVLRHTDAYKYNNIWLNVGLQVPGDSMFFQKVDLALATDAAGWEGSGMNDIWEVRKLLNGQPRRFKKAGEYKFIINHVMRDNPLPDVMSAGMRVERAK